MLSRHLWLQRPVALQTMSEGLEKKKKKRGRATWTELMASKKFSNYPHIFLQVGIYARARGYKTLFQPGARVRVNLILKPVILDLKTTTNFINSTGNPYLAYFWTY